MKKLIAAFLVVSTTLAAVVWTISQIIKPAAPVEAPEITQARTSAQLASIERDMSNASFLTTLTQWAAIVILLLIVVIIFAGVILVLSHVKHRQRVELIKLQHDTSLLMPTVEGNYPALVVNRRAGEVVRLEPGNKPYPRPAAQFVIGNSPLARIPTSRHDVPILLNTGGQRMATPAAPEYRVRPVEPDQLQGPGQDRQVVSEIIQPDEVELNSEANSNSELEQFAQFGELLARAKREGRGKNQSIQEVTGVRAGGSKAYKQYSLFWDNLV
jgi:NADH:ubiquinone oxidoreductase subunit 3 (subunit A)